MVFDGMAQLSGLNKNSVLISFEQKFQGSKVDTSIELELDIKQTEDGLELTGDGNAEIQSVLNPTLKPSYKLTDCQGALR